MNYPTVVPISQSVKVTHGINLDENKDNFRLEVYKPLWCIMIAELNCQKVLPCYVGTNSNNHDTGIRPQIHRRMTANGTI